MFEVRVETEFSAAHFLRDYNGKCERLHGHNYTVYAHVRGSVLNEGGMLFDFSRLKAALRQVCGTLDHCNLNDIPAFEQNPSAERIACYIYNALTAAIPELRRVPGEGAGAAYLAAVDVFETATSRARYSVD